AAAAQGLERLCGGHAYRHARIPTSASHELDLEARCIGDRLDLRAAGEQLREQLQRAPAEILVALIEQRAQTIEQLEASAMELQELTDRRPHQQRIAGPEHLGHALPDPAVVLLVLDTHEALQGRQDV